MDLRRTQLQQPQQAPPQGVNQNGPACSRGNKSCGANNNQGQGQQRNYAMNATQRAYGTSWNGQRQDYQNDRQQDEERICFMYCPDHHGRREAPLPQNDQGLPSPPPGLPDFSGPRLPGFNVPSGPRFIGPNTRSNNNQGQNESSSWKAFGSGPSGRW